ncbi:MAG TPA: lipocalin-like domain-containing protein, partial [Aestuariivirgaceae bacterium]|nr:lipocalin-like domain-containing protein [Aestuariivirgaceae bacterium]
WQREIVATGERVDALGADPVGYLSYGEDGRMSAIVVRRERQPPADAVATDDEKLRLFDGMLAYAGTFTVLEDKVVHHVDASWNEHWTGTDQVRFYKLDGDILTVDTAPASDPHTGEQVIHKILFRKL